MSCCPTSPPLRLLVIPGLNDSGPGPWLAVAHSYGCLALLQHLAARAQPGARCGVVAALLVAPANPQRHGVAARLQQRAALREITVVASSNDPWLPTGAALPWAQRWGARLLDLGDAGHINIASGHGPWPLGRTLVERQLQRWHAACRLATEADAQPRASAQMLRAQLSA